MQTIIAEKGTMNISVIIPTSSPQAYLWECLDSLSSQTLSSDLFEIILVLNGCKEPYEKQITDYIEGHPNLQIRYIQSDEKGVSRARNYALDIARGEYIAFIDDDDFVSSFYLEGLYAVASSDTISICYPYAYNDGNIDTQLPYSMTDCYQRCAHKGKLHFLNARKFLSGPWMKLIHRDCIGHRRFDTRFINGEDALFIFLISDSFKYINFSSPKSIYYRRFRKNSAISKQRTLKQIIRNNCAMMREFTRIYFQGHYSTFFYVTRILASFKSIIFDTFISLVRNLHHNSAEIQRTEQMRK